MYKKILEIIKNITNDDGIAFILLHKTRKREIFLFHFNYILFSLKQHKFLKIVSFILRNKVNKSDHHVPHITGLSRTKKEDRQQNNKIFGITFDSISQIN